MKKQQHAGEQGVTPLSPNQTLWHVPIVCCIGAAKSFQDLPIQAWRNIRPVKGAHPSNICGAIINGESLIDEGVYDGDIVIVRLHYDTHEISPGRLVAVFTPFGLLIKHIYPTLNSKVRLVSANALYEDIVLDAEEVAIQGIVERVERDL